LTSKIYTYLLHISIFTANNEMTFYLVTFLIGLSLSFNRTRTDLLSMRIQGYAMKCFHFVCEVQFSYFAYI
jgi:hypothetical protein